MLRLSAANLMQIVVRARSAPWRDRMGVTGKIGLRDRLQPCRWETNWNDTNHINQLDQNQSRDDRRSAIQAFKIIWLAAITAPLDDTPD